MCSPLLQWHVFHGHNELAAGTDAGPSAQCTACGEHDTTASSLTNGDLCADTPPVSISGALWARGDGDDEEGGSCITLGGNIGNSNAEACGRILPKGSDPASGFGNLMS